MHSFQWKSSAKKTLGKGGKKRLSAFEDNENEIEIDEDVDWLTATKRKKSLSLEDTKTKVQRLTEEGITFAHLERWWEAIGRWQGALALDPELYKVHDMVAQAYLKVGEVYPALGAATKAVNFAPNWWPGLQTHGRALLNLGEVAMAVKSFSKAVHLHPGDQELWQEDLQWSVTLMNQQKDLEKQEEVKNSLETDDAFKLEELEDENFMNENNDNIVSSSKSSTAIITCTSKKQRDDRFEKPVVKYDLNGVIPTSRSLVDPKNMICYRSQH